MVTNINKAHQVFGHIGSDAVCASCKHMDWKFVRKASVPCASCVVAKMKRKTIIPTKGHIIGNQRTGRRLFIDISSVRFRESGKMTSKLYWLIIVEEETQAKFSRFLRRKKELSDTMCSLVNKWRKGRMNIKFIRLDNAGKNKAFEEQLNGKEWHLNLTFEFTGPDTPQQNHLAEVAFSTLWGQVRAIMHQAMVPEEKEHLLYQEAISHATRLDGLVLVTVKGMTKTQYEHLLGKNPRFVHNMKAWEKEEW